MKGTTGMPDLTETIAAEYPHTAEGRRGPTWSGWLLSILVAVVLSVTATLLLGGSGVFRSDRAAGTAGDCGSGIGSSNYPHSTVGK
jgi:hypothetical protein